MPNRRCVSTPFGPAWWYRELGLAHFGAGRYEEAIAWHKKSVNLNPKISATDIALTTAYRWAGRNEDAHAQAAEVLRINPNASVEERAKTLYHTRIRPTWTDFLMGCERLG